MFEDILFFSKTNRNIEKWKRRGSFPSGRKPELAQCCSGFRRPAERRQHSQNILWMEQVCPPVPQRGTSESFWTRVRTTSGYTDPQQDGCQQTTEAGPSQSVDTDWTEQTTDPGWTRCINCLNVQLRSLAYLMSAYKG
ncbi:hypothetical protein Q5P01_024070 [Channa striata]|uniref:Uncharacterized protein n=1 Tax=Channa striata TaxID=64152 RepID=A0AA88IT03_CHASR|nr:hypothetical protein Q5P01_024070 [Channa striata]